MTADQASDAASIEVVLFDPSDGHRRVLEAVRSLGLVGVVIDDPFERDLGVIIALVAAAPDGAPLTLRDGALVACEPAELAERLRARCVASVFVSRGAELLAETVLPASIDRAQAFQPLGRWVVAPHEPLSAGLSLEELASMWRTEVVAIDVDGRDLVTATVAMPSWPTIQRPAVAIRVLDDGLEVAIHARDPLPGQPRRRGPERLLPDVALRWTPPATPIVVEPAGDARMRQVAVERHSQPLVEDAAVAVVRAAMRELRRGRQADALIALAERPWSREVAHAVCDALDIPEAAMLLGSGAVDAAGLPGVRVQAPVGVGRMLRAMMRAQPADADDRSTLVATWMVAALLGIGGIVGAVAAVSSLEGHAGPLVGWQIAWTLLAAGGLTAAVVMGVDALRIVGRRRRRREADLAAEQDVR